MRNIDEKKENLLKKLLNYDDEYIENTLYPNAFRKLRCYLEDKQVTETFRDIKKKIQINIQGMDSNGKERLILKEIREKMGMDQVEANEVFCDLMPIVEDGVIRYETIDGVFYLNFKVISQTEKTFGLKIYEYRYSQGFFYLTYIVTVKEISKKLPLYISESEGLDVRTILFSDEYLGRSSEKYFEDIEKAIISTKIRRDQDANGELELILCNTLSYLRVVNYFYKNNFDKFENNEYFALKNWANSQSDDLETKFNKSRQDYADSVLDKVNEPIIIKENTIEMILERILKRDKIGRVVSAVGFTYRSGLVKINRLLNDLFLKDGKLELIVGALQNYNLLNDKNNRIDKATVIYLNDLLKNKKIDLYTLENKFYHGKFYYLCGEKYAYVIMGSTNISKTAFEKNFELDMLYVLNKGSALEIQFLAWYSSLKKQCRAISYLNENMFEDFIRPSELDVYRNNEKNTVSLSEIKKRIDKLTDEETKQRLNLWMKHNPTVVFENVELEALSSYVMYVFEENELAVFESFIPQNAYYVFSCPNGVDDLIANLRLMTKTQMAMSEWYVRRGNHVSDIKKIEQKISKFFE